MNKLAKNKFVIILLLMVVFLFFGSVTNTLVLNNRGIVVGMGLHLTESGDIGVACQILVAGDMGADNANNDNYAILTSSGKTFGEATQKMLVDSAEFMSYAHCNSVIVDRKMIESGKLFLVLDELLKNSKITENTELVYYEGNPSELLKKKVGINLMASFAIQRMISGSKRYVDVAPCTIRDYLVAVKSDAVCVMPKVVVEDGVDEPTTSNEQKGENKVILSVREGVCLTGNEILKELTIEEVGYYNIMEKDFDRGVFFVTIDGEARSVEFRKKTVEKEFSQDGTAKAKVEIEVVESLLISDSEGRKEGEKEQISKKISLVLAQGIEKLHEDIRKMKKDIFSLHEEFVQCYGEQKGKEYSEIEMSVGVKTTLKT